MQAGASSISAGCRQLALMSTDHHILTAKQNPDNCRHSQSRYHSTSMDDFGHCSLQSMCNYQYFHVLMLIVRGKVPCAPVGRRNMDGTGALPVMTSFRTTIAAITQACCSWANANQHVLSNYVM